MARNKAGRGSGKGGLKRNLAQRAKSIVSRTTTVFPDLARLMTPQDYFEYILISPSCQRGRRTVTSVTGRRKITPLTGVVTLPSTSLSAESASCGKARKQSGRRKRATGTTGRKRTG